MALKVGSKGQVVIAKEIRDKLGIEQGWIAFEQLVDDHVEIYFLPPEHRRSLMGVLAEYSKVRVGEGDEWDKARESAWRAAAFEKMGLKRAK